MNAENGLAILLLLTGGIFILAAAALKIFPPKNINSLYGYRTFRSMRNEETWKEGNKYGANAMIITGVILLMCGILAYLYLPNLGEKSGLLGIGAIILASIFMIIITERHLISMFDKEGNRKAKN